MELTQEQILELMVSILGSNIDGANWKSDGPAGTRNALLTTERVITRALNDFDTRILSALSTVDGFKARFDEVVGKNYTDDEEVFNQIGSNLIIAINDLKDAIANLTESDIPNIGINKVIDLQASLDSKVDDSRILTDVPVDAKFTDTVYIHPDNHPVSLIAGLQDILDAKTDNDRVLTDVPVNAKFTDTVYVHPDNHQISVVDGLQEVLDDTLNKLHDADPEAHADIRANMVIKDIGTFDTVQAVIQHAISNQLPNGIYKLITDLSGQGIPMDAIVMLFNIIELHMMGAVVLSAGTVIKMIVDTNTMNIVDTKDAFISAPETKTRIMKNIIINTSNWAQGETYYEYYIYIDDMTEDGIADVNIRLEDLEKASVIKSANKSIEGNVILYADAIPESEIMCDIKYTIPTPMPESPPPPEEG